MSMNKNKMGYHREEDDELDYSCCTQPIIQTNLVFEEVNKKDIKVISLNPEDSILERIKKIDASTIESKSIGQLTEHIQEIIKDKI